MNPESVVLFSHKKQKNEKKNVYKFNMGGVRNVWYTLKRDGGWWLAGAHKETQKKWDFSSSTSS